MGIKPFLYYFQDNYFVFSTELKSIVKLPLVETEIDNLYLRDKAIGIFDAPNKTAWKNIIRLRAANMLYFNDNDIVKNQYWQPVYKRNPYIKTEQQSAEGLQRILEKVIADHTRVIGGVGVPLSGGLDSSTIACLAAKKLAVENKQLTTVSSVLHPESKEGDIKDEMEYIEEVLKQEKNIDANFIYDTDFEFLINLEEIFNRHYTTVNYFYYVDEGLYKKFNSKSVRRSVSGYLGDITASNRKISPLPNLFLSGKLNTFFKLARLIKKKGDDNLFFFVKINIIKPVLPFFLLKIGYHFLGRKPPWDITSIPLILSDKEKKSLEKKKISYFRNTIKYQHDIAKNIWPSSFEPIGEDFDCGSSHYQLEITYPFIDRRVVEFLLEIPIEHFYAGGLKRGLIRKAMEKILPEKIKDRKTKHPYSPAHYHITKKYLPAIKSILKNKVLEDYIGHLLDNKKVDIQLESVAMSKSSHNFDINYVSFLKTIILVSFTNWSIQKNK
jgi:asparagine synthase (glutamine-hydrolysing)